jgi:multiple sugar transport system substrate-binding protein
MFAAAGLTNPRALAGNGGDGQILTNAEKGVYGLGLANSLWWHLPFLYLFGADVLSDNYQECTLDNDRARSAFAFLNSLYREHRVEGGAWKAGAINPDQGFINKRYAMIVSGPWNIKNFSSVNYGISLIPGNGNIPSATNIGGTSMIVLRNSPQKQQSVRFLTYLTSQAVQLEWARKRGR